jgi:hypothetical protein
VLAFTDNRGVQTVRLDATPLGQPLYERLGFAPQYSLTRFAGRAPVVTRCDSSNVVKPAQLADAKAILQLDREVMSTDRSKFLLLLLKEQPERSHVVFQDERLSGFVTMRPGSNAWQLGPCIAEADTGGTLLHHACNQLAGEVVYVDIPEPNALAMQWAAEAGLERQRRLLRMCRGAEVMDHTNQLWASSGPELG